MYGYGYLQENDLSFIDAWIKTVDAVWTQRILSEDRKVLYV